MDSEIVAEPNNRRSAQGGGVGRFRRAEGVEKEGALEGVGGEIGLEEGL